MAVNAAISNRCRQKILTYRMPRPRPHSASLKRLRSARWARPASLSWGVGGSQSSTTIKPMAPMAAVTSNTLGRPPQAASKGPKTNANAKDTPILAPMIAEALVR